MPGARVLRSDVIRKRLFGVAPETRLPSSAYDKATNERVYRKVYDEAAAALGAGYSVIADAAFLDPAERAAIAVVAARAGVPFTGLWLEARAKTLRQRIAARRGDASDADRAVLDFQLSRDLGPLDWARVDASGSIRSVTAAAGRYLFSGGVPLESDPMRGDKSSAGAAPRPRPVVLCILDGWGHRRERADNAIALAKAPNWHRFLRDCPHALLEASETFVGLPSGQMGNSEVGHMNLGAGRVVMQDLPRIDQAVADGSLAKNKALAEFVAKLKKRGGTAHLLGLLSPGGVHSHQDHIAALAKALDAAGVTTVCHAFLDGRDTPPKSALGFVERFEGATKGLKQFRFGTIGGRYYGMDRDKRWDREQQAYDAMVAAKGDRAKDAKSAIEEAYARGESDEFVKPTVIGDYAGMKDGDGLVSANFRADRIRQILTALLDPKFDGFKRGKVVKFAAALGMTQYSDALDPLLATLFPPERPDETFGQIVSEAGLKQLRIAETEKYAHVTFFFNGGREDEFPGETRILVPSPKVKTYDLKPEMSANEVTDKLVDAIGKGTFDAIACNFANADMVGHTGDEAAAIRAVETLDHCLGRIATAVKRAGGCLLITADHGNAELMRDPETHEPHTAHTLNPVPVILVNGPPGVTSLENGRLADIAPTLLALMGLTRPKAMTGHPLFHAAHVSATV
jgi:2,3-bisphosphoglycerate-independent phosphoglycerate mutase